MTRILFICMLALGGCGTYVEDRRSIDYAPVYAPDIQQTEEPSFGGIYTSSKGTLFAMEGRANKVGDILTVAFAESFQATKSQNAATSRSTESAITLPSALDKAVPGSSLSSDFLSSSGENTFSGSGSTAQSNSLTGSVSVHVVRVFQNGNLEILGQKKLTLNNGDEYIRVSGIVRPRDISADNVVQSDRIANAEINYVGAGDIARTGKKGWYTKFLETIAPI
ncbi:MAG: flagellar basal body L-ring protein FlgH [Paracoccaceae bacterium]|jgi:flagellar L-ring protein precursor FlgH